MKIRTIKDVQDFVAIVNKCKGEVWLESIHGDKYNLKSALTQYVAMADLVRDHNDELELFASNAEDEAILMDFIANHQ